MTRLGILAIVLTCSCPGRGAMGAAAPMQPTTLRVLCYNIQHGEGVDGKVDLPRLARVIRAADPDLVALQEVDNRTNRTGRVDQTAELARLTGLNGRFGRQIDFEGGEYGQAVLSRFPIESGTIHILPGEPDRQRRMAFEVRVVAHGAKIRLATTHLHHFDGGFRERQAVRLNEVLAEGEGPVILAGDLNAEPGSPPVERLRRTWTIASGETPLATYPADKPKKTIDFVMTRRQDRLRVVSAQVLDEPVASDHRPVLVVFERTSADAAASPAAPGTRDAPAYPPYARPTLIAHRGASGGAPEHTLPAYELALKQGADFVEPDLQITRDGVLVCLHDATLERTTNVAQLFPGRARELKGRKTWPVADLTLAEVKTLDAGSWKDKRFAGARVPTLQEMIDLVKGKAGVIPETKAPEVYGRKGFDMEGLLLEVLRKNRLEQPGADPRTPVVIQSFSPDSLRRLRRDLGCRLPMVYLFDTGETTMERLKAAREFADGLGPSKKLLLANPRMVADAHSLGMSVTTWTFRSTASGRFRNVRQEMGYFLRDLRVDALFTDDPDQFPRD